MWAYWIAGALIGFSALGKAVQDSIAHHNALKRLGAWWDSDISWQWKYKQPYQPSYAQDVAERFWGSSRWFVGLTDAWHCFGMLRDTCWQVAFCLLIPDTIWYKLIAFVAIKVMYGSAFETLYQYLNKKA